MEAINISEFIAKHGLTMTSEYTVFNPNMPEWQANHYKVHLRCGRKRLNEHYSQGFGISGEPKIENVLDCLVVEAVSIDNTPCFHDWATEFGYDTDSIKARKMWKACVRQADKLEKFLGHEAFRELLYETERL